MYYQPKPTWFDGVLYRSATEARWACFWKGMGITYQYEPVLPWGYVADFRIEADFMNRRHVACVEIKPEKSDHLISQVEGIARRLFSTSMILLCGSPYNAEYEIVFCNSEFWSMVLNPPYSEAGAKAVRLFVPDPPPGKTQCLDIPPPIGSKRQVTIDEINRQLEDAIKEMGL